MTSESDSRMASPPSCPPCRGRWCVPRPSIPIPAISTAAVKTAPIWSGRGRRRWSIQIMARQQSPKEVAPPITLPKGRSSRRLTLHQVGPRRGAGPCRHRLPRGAIMQPDLGPKGAHGEHSLLERSAPYHDSRSPPPYACASCASGNGSPVGWGRPTYSRNDGPITRPSLR
jgi:hypothetical protein